MHKSGGILVGCLWLVIGMFGALFVAGAAGVSINAVAFLIPLLGLPVLLASLLARRGVSRRLLATSAFAGLGFVTLGIWNYVRAAEFEQSHPGSTDISGGGISLVFIALSLIVTGASALAAVALRSNSDIPRE